jgi:gluconolactonase
MADEARIEVVHESFRDVLLPDSRLELVGSGYQFTEGPVWMAKDRRLLFSDIPADTIYGWTEKDGVAAFRKPSHSANGNTCDLQGRLLTCEHASRTLTRTGPDGAVSTLASTYKGRRLNSPNDVVVKSDGTIWFTDPPYGIQRREIEQPANYVFRLDPGAAEPVAVADDFTYPNGLCFSPDERMLFIANSDPKVHHVRAFHVGADNALRDGEVFAVIAPGVPDGMRMDLQDRLYCTSAEGVHVLSPEGKLLGKVRTPQTAANCAFGGPDNTTLFITASTQVWRVRLAAVGAAARPAPGEASP